MGDEAVPHHRDLRPGEKGRQGEEQQEHPGAATPGGALERQSGV
jgi:hypothetical protein